MEPCVTNVTVRWNAVITETETAVFPVQEVFQNQVEDVSFCFFPTQFAPHWASLESKGGEVLSGLSPGFSLPLQSLSVLMYG